MVKLTIFKTFKGHIDHESDDAGIRDSEIMETFFTFSILSFEMYLKLDICHCLQIMKRQPYACLMFKSDYIFLK